MVPSFTIPEKLYFKIGEVSKIVGVEPYVLRYWETEFRDVVPVKSRTNQRLYRRRDVDLLLRIKELLYRERFTINGAKKRLKEDGRDKKEGPSHSPQLGLKFEGDEKKALDKIKHLIKADLAGLVKEMNQLFDE